MASDVQLTAASKFVRSNFIELLGLVILQLPPQQILRKVRMYYLDSILSVGIFGLDWIQTVYHMCLETIDGSSKGDSN